MSSSAINNNQMAANKLPNNPFSHWKSSVNQDPENTVASNLPDELAMLIFSKMKIEQVQTIMESSETRMEPDFLYQNMINMKTSLTGKELEEFLHPLALEKQPLLQIEEIAVFPEIASLAQYVSSVFQYMIGNKTQHNETVQLQPWADTLANHPLSLSALKYLDLSDSPNITNADVIRLTKSSPNLTKLILPGAFPSDEVMAILRTNCPHAAIYPSAMTEHEWAHPAEFMKKLPPPPKEIADFINGPRPIWPGKTSAEMHMVMPKVNKIFAPIAGRYVMLPWTLQNISKLDNATGGPGCLSILDEILKPGNDKPSEVGFEWVVFTKDILPESRNELYDNQKQLVEQWGYEVPGVLDATTFMLWENRLSNSRIYNDDPWTYTHCKEKFGRDCYLITGGFVLGGPRISVDLNNGGYDIGVGGLKKFNVSSTTSSAVPKAINN